MALEFAIPRLDAKRLRRALKTAPDVRLSVDEVYELILAETENRDAAEHAAKSYMAAQLRTGQTPD